MIIPKITNVEELMAELESGDYNYYGLRGAHEADLIRLDVGYLEPSYVWIDGECTDELLNGTSAIGVSENLSEKELLKRYKTARDVYAFDTKVVLLVGDAVEEYGEDENEVILGSDGWGADIIAIVELE